MNKKLMKLDGLAPLKNSMADHHKTSAHFDFAYNNATFDCLFLTDQTPFILGIGKKGSNPFYIELDVHPGYRVDIYLDKEDYQKLCDAIGLDPFSGAHGFRTSEFFRVLNKNVPTKYSERTECRPEHIADHKRDATGSDGRFFMGWRRNGDFGDVRPTNRNLTKTRTLLGEAAYERALAENLSSSWTDQESLAIRVSYGDDIEV